MTEVRDFTTHAALREFPWEAVYKGLALAKKTVTTFNVGAIYKHGLASVPDPVIRPSDKRWYLALKHGYAVEGFNVNVTDPARGIDISEAILGCWNPLLWTDNPNTVLFEKLRQWIKESGIFQCTGRISFFLTLPGQLSPQHTDFTYSGIDARARVECTDFLWLTPPDNPKALLSQGKQVPWACWFDPFEIHETLASPNTQWSLRIDGKYSDGLPILHPKIVLDQ